MSPTEVREAIRGVLKLLEPDSRDPAEREAALRLALDRLCLAAATLRPTFSGEPPTFADGDPPLPVATYPDLYQRLAPLFPGLGYYNAVTELQDKLMDSSVLAMADGLDDLADIMLDLLEVQSLWETLGEPDALWEFRFGFESHWGYHLRALQLLLHARAWR